MNKYKNRLNMSPFLIVCTVLVVFLILVVGYTSFSSNMSILAQALVRVQRDIRVTGVGVSNTTNGASSNYEEYNINNITSSVNLPNANSTITYHIEVTNIGNVEEGILSIDEIYKIFGTNNDSDLEIKSKTVNLKESLCDDNISNRCKLGSVSTFDITIGYKNNGYNANNLNHSIELDFDFERMFDITYSDFSGSTSNLPSKMIEGDNLTIVFDSTCGIPDSVNVTGANSSYNSPNLVLSNVTDNITISAVYTPADPYIYVVNIQDFILKGQPIPSNITTYDNPTAARASFHNSPFYFKHYLENNLVAESYLIFIITPEFASDHPRVTAGEYTLRGGVDETQSSTKPIYNSNLNELKRAFGENNEDCSDFSNTSIVSCYTDYNVQVQSDGLVSLYTYIDAVNDVVYCAVDADGDSHCVI